MKTLSAPVQEIDSIPMLMQRLDTLLDLEMRILDQAQYDLLPDITAEKNDLQKRWQMSMRQPRDDAPDPMQNMSEIQQIQKLQNKLKRNNTRLLAKREACLARIRACWMATRSDGATRYDEDGSISTDMSQMILNLKL